MEKMDFLSLGRKTQMLKTAGALQPEAFLLEVYHKGSNLASMKVTCIRTSTEALSTRAKKLECSKNERWYLLYPLGPSNFLSPVQPNPEVAVEYHLMQKYGYDSVSRKLSYKTKYVI